ASRATCRSEARMSACSRVTELCTSEEEVARSTSMFDRLPLDLSAWLRPSMNPLKNRNRNAHRAMASAVRKVLSGRAITLRTLYLSGSATLHHLSEAFHHAGPRGGNGRREARGEPDEQRHAAGERQ